MSLLKTIDPNSTEAPRESKPVADRLISGDPSFKTWAQDVARDGLVHTGIWEATPGVTRSIKGETFEFCHILDGVVELTPDGGEPVTYKTGDSFVIGLRRHLAHRGDRPEDLCDGDVITIGDAPPRKRRCEDWNDRR